MKFKLVAALIFTSATALAGPHDDLASARQHAQAASTRVSYLEIEVQIAERDAATARIIQDTATKQRSRALRDGDSEAASASEQRHAVAVKEEREALARIVEKRAARDRAVEDARSSTARAAQLERGVRASR
jgi:hypothetical protein